MTDEAKPTEKQHVFDKPRNVKLVIRLLFAICVLLVLADFFVHRHVGHVMETLPGFYAFYGFVACVVLVVLAKEMRKLLMRSEDYYDSVDD